jgi:hypothetical protein
MVAARWQSPGQNKLGCIARGNRRLWPRNSRGPRRQVFVCGVVAAVDDGRVFEMKPGDVFYIEPGHDSWVVGDEPYVSLHLVGAGDYAAHKPAGKQ